MTSAAEGVVTTLNKYFEILGLKIGASEDEIRKAYRLKSAKHHPDVGGDSEVFKKINDAYEYITGVRETPLHSKLKQLLLSTITINGNWFHNCLKSVSEAISQQNNHLSQQRGYLETLKRRHRDLEINENSILKKIAAVELDRMTEECQKKIDRMIEIQELNHEVKRIVEQCQGGDNGLCLKLSDIMGTGTGNATVDIWFGQ